MADRVFDLAWTHSQVSLHRSMPAMPTRNCTVCWPGPSCTPTPRCVRSRASSRTTVADSPACGAIPFPAICLSCSWRSRKRRISSWSANWFGPTPIGAARIESRSGDLERGSLRLQASLARRDHGRSSPRGERATWPIDRAASYPAGRPDADEDRILLQTVARVVLSDARGDLTDQIEPAARRVTVPPPFATPCRRTPAARLSPAPSGRAPI